MSLSMMCLPSSKLDAIRTSVRSSSESAIEPESVRLKRLNDEKAARKAVLKAERQAKEQAHAEKLAAAEAALVEIDRQEALFREAAREREVEAANRKLWNQTDRVRELHAKMLLSEVLAEREAQIAVRRHLEGLEAEERAAFHVKLLQRIQEEEASEQEQQRGMRSRALQLRAMQDQQLEELKLSILADRERNRLEGERLRREAALDMQAAKAQALEVRRKAQLANEATRDANLVLKALKAEEKARERLADQARAEHARQQEAVQKARRAERAARATEKEARRQAMVDLMERTYLASLKQTDERLEADVAAADERATAAAVEAARRRQEDWAAIDRSRQQQLAQKKSKKAAQKAAEAAFAKAWAEQLKGLQAEEVAQAKEAQHKHQEYVAFLQRQIDLKEAKKKAADAHLLEEDVVGLWAMADKEAMFEQYAAVCVDEWRRRGRDATPLELFLKSSSKPRLSPSL